MSLPTKVDIVEVGTRDGLQNEKQYITPEDKIKLLDTITDAGVRRIEVTSFVSPKHVPQMRDAQEVLAGCKRNPNTEYEALVPNVRGMERALACELDGVMLFVAASETFNQKNIRASRAEMLGVAREVAKMAKGANLKLRGGVVATFGCPYEGRISYQDVEWVVGEYVDMGCEEIGLADTVGMSNPAEIKKLTEHIRNKFPPSAMRFTSTTRGDPVSPIFWRAWKSVSIRSIPPSAAWAVVPSPPAPPATSRARIRSTCSTRWG